VSTGLATKCTGAYYIYAGRSNSFLTRALVGQEGSPEKLLRFDSLHFVSPLWKEMESIWGGLRLKGWNGRITRLQ
jgi:hypothetical protein